LHDYTREKEIRTSPAKSRRKLLLLLQNSRMGHKDTERKRSKEDPVGCQKVVAFFKNDHVISYILYFCNFTSSTTLLSELEECMKHPIDSCLLSISIPRPRIFLSAMKIGNNIG